MSFSKKTMPYLSEIYDCICCGERQQEGAEVWDNGEGTYCDDCSDYKKECCRKTELEAADKEKNR